MKSDFSEKELKLIEKLSPIRYQEIILDKSDIPPIILFEEIALDCFLENDWGTEVESLRNMLKAIRSCVMFRNTEEFENLIEIEE